MRRLGLRLRIWVHRQLGSESVVWGEIKVLKFWETKNLAVTCCFLYQLNLRRCDSWHFRDFGLKQHVLTGNLAHFKGR
jgi:hypothetical protein